jgi:hypothetical protein
MSDLDCRIVQVRTLKRKGKKIKDRGMRRGRRLRISRRKRRERGGEEG